MSFDLPSLRNVKLGVDNNRLTAILCAVLDAQGGKVTLTKEQSERIWEGATLRSEQHENGDLTLILEPRH